MIVIVRIEVDDRVRKVIGYRYGSAGSATRSEVRREVENVFTAYLDDICAEYDEGLDVARKANRGDQS